MHSDAKDGPPAKCGLSGSEGRGLTRYVKETILGIFSRRTHGLMRVDSYRTLVSRESSQISRRCWHDFAVGGSLCYSESGDDLDVI